PPVTPPAPCTRTVCPACTPSASSMTWAAVSAGTHIAAPALNGTPAGSGATCPAGAMCRSAQAPCSRGGTECTGTRSPGRHPVTRRDAGDRAPGGHGNPGRLDAEGQRRPGTQVPAAGPGDLVPVAHPAGPHVDQDLVRAQLPGVRQVQDPDRAARPADARRPH